MDTVKKTESAAWWALAAILAAIWLIGMAAWLIGQS